MVPQRLRVPDICETVPEFITWVARVRKEWFDDGDPWGPLFRGQKKASWKLLPNLYRTFGPLAAVKEDEIEDEIREEFAARAPILSETNINVDAWNLYFLMQHYGAPTRLLDWTEGALIALYFAVRDNQGLHDAAVWALDPYELNRRSIGYEEVYAPNDPGIPKKQKNRVARWLPERFNSKLEIPAAPVAVYPTHTARRMSTQRSCFTVHGTDPNGLDCVKSGYLKRIIVPSFRATTIKQELDALGIDETTIFPDLDGLGRAVSNRWRIAMLPPPHEGVYARLAPSKLHGVGVFAIRRIPNGTRIFQGENDEMTWVESKVFSRVSARVKRLYGDFAVINRGRFGCPQNFNRLTMSWYLNEPGEGDTANVKCVADYDFAAARDISIGEELTVDYSSFSDPPNSHSK